MKRVPYQEFMRKIWECSEFCDSSIVASKSYFVKKDMNDNLDSAHIISFHSCILSARSRFFHKHFLKCSKLVLIDMPFMVEHVYLSQIMQYLYTGLLEFDLQYLDKYLELSKKLHLSHLEKELLIKKSFLQHNHQSAPLKRYLNKNMFITKFCLVKLFILDRKWRRRHKRKDKIESCIVTIEGEAEVEKLKSDMGCLNTTKILKMGISYEKYCDIKFHVENDTFLCHKIFFVNRSEYFRAMIEDHFSETVLSDKIYDDTMTDQRCLPLIHIKDITSPVFTNIMRYVYEDRVDIPSELLFEVLQAADKFLMPGLKKLCSDSIANNLDNENVVSVLQASRLYNLPNLEDACARYITQKLEDIIGLNEFHEVVKTDAHLVINRQETDTISIIDDIRFYITNHVQTFSAMKSADEKLRLLDSLLDTLGLEA